MVIFSKSSPYSKQSTSYPPTLPDDYMTLKVFLLHLGRQLLFAGGLSSGLEPLRDGPHLVFRPKVPELVKEVDDFVFPLKGVGLLFEPTKVVQDVELLPTLGKVDFSVKGVAVAEVDKGQVLQNQAHIRDARWTAKNNIRLILNVQNLPKVVCYIKSIACQSKLHTSIYL